MKTNISKNSRIFVLIPVLNEEKSIGLVIDDIPKNIVTEIVVIDNGSIDNTAVIARTHGATVLSETKKGYGHALMTGFHYISRLNPGIIVFIDGDFSDYPNEIPGVIQPIIDEGYDLVIGSRVLGKSEKGALLPQARFGNWLSTTLIKLFWRYRFTDLGPFRAITFDKFQELEMKELTYGWTVEMQIKAAKKNTNARKFRSVTGRESGNQK